MSASDWIVGVVLAPLLIAGVWVVVVRVWRVNLQVTQAVSWFTGEGKGVVGYHAFLGPAVTSMTLLWAGMIATMIENGMGSPPGWLGPAIGICFVIGLAFMLLAFWMWVFRWPTFLVPPAFRVPTANHDQRATDNQL